MSLHDRIIGQLPDDITRESEAFYEGFAEASRKASHIAKEADDLIAEMAVILESASFGSIVINSAKDVLDKYEDWKEKNK